MVKVNNKEYRCVQGYSVKVDTGLLPRLKNAKLEQMRRLMIFKRACEYNTRSDFRETAGHCMRVKSTPLKLVFFDRRGKKSETRELIAEPCYANFPKRSSNQKKSYLDTKETKIINRLVNEFNRKRLLFLKQKNKNALDKAENYVQRSLEFGTSWIRIYKKFSDFKFNITPNIDARGKNMLTITIYDNNGHHRDTHFNLYYHDDGNVSHTPCMMREGKKLFYYLDRNDFMYRDRKIEILKR